MLKNVPLGRDATVLELGCGDGFQLSLLRQRFAGVVAIDPANVPEEAGGCAYAVAEALPFRDETFDLIVSNCVLEHLTDRRLGLEESVRILKPGGRIGISDVIAEDRLSAAERAERGPYVGCIAGALSRSEYHAGLEAAGFEQISVTFTHRVADGMHSGIIKAAKTREPRLGRAMRPA